MKPSGAHTWPLTYGCFLRHPLRVKNPSVVTGSIWIFDECPMLHFSLEVLLTITVRQPKLHRIQHLYLVFVVTAGADCITRVLSVFVYVWFVTHWISAGIPNNPPFQSVLLALINTQMVVQPHSMYLEKRTVFMAKLRFRPAIRFLGWLSLEPNIISENTDSSASRVGVSHYSPKCSPFCFTFLTQIKQFNQYIHARPSKVLN